MKTHARDEAKNFRQNKLQQNNEELDALFFQTLEVRLRRLFSVSNFQ